MSTSTTNQSKPKLPFDYSKWDKIDLSDDEDDFHPNIDNASFIRMKHQSHIERRAHELSETQRLTKEMEAKTDEMEAIAERRNQVREKIGSASADSSADENLDAELSTRIQSLADEIASRRKQVEQIEKDKKLYADDLCHVVSEKTIVNSDTKEAVNLDYNEYKSKYFPLLFQYQSLDPSRLDDAEEYIRKNPEILSEHATGYLLLRCMDLAMEEPSTSTTESPLQKMRKVARLEMILQYIMDLANSLKQDPRSAVAPFFRRLTDEKVKLDFDKAAEDFAVKVEKRAEERKKENEASGEKFEPLAQAGPSSEKGDQEEEEEYVELSREERLGPGGLDPVEVFESLPPDLQKCFETEDVPMLKKVLSQMDQGQAAYYLKKCVDSGLWVEAQN